MGILRIFDDQMLPEPTAKATKAACVFHRTHQPTPHPREFHPFYFWKKKKATLKLRIKKNVPDIWLGYLV